MQVTKELLENELEGLKRQLDEAQTRAVKLSGAIAAVSALLEYAKRDELPALSEQELAEAVAGHDAKVEEIADVKGH